MREREHAKKVLSDVNLNVLSSTEIDMVTFAHEVCNTIYESVKAKTNLNIKATEIFYTYQTLCLYIRESIFEKLGVHLVKRDHIKNFTYIRELKINYFFSLDETVKDSLKRIVKQITEAILKLETKENAKHVSAYRRRGLLENSNVAYYYGINQTMNYKDILLAILDKVAIMNKSSRESLKTRGIVRLETIVESTILQALRYKLKTRKELFEFFYNTSLLNKVVRCINNRADLT